MISSVVSEEPATKFLLKLATNSSYQTDNTFGSVQFETFQWEILVNANKLTSAFNCQKSKRVAVTRIACCHLHDSSISAANQERGKWLNYLHTHTHTQASPAWWRNKHTPFPLCILSVYMHADTPHTYMHRAVRYTWAAKFTRSSRRRGLIKKMCTEKFLEKIKSE